MKKILKYLVLPTLVFSAAACTDLTENLEGDLTEEIVIDGIPDPNNTSGGGPLDGAYSKLRDGSAGHGATYSIQEITTDEMCIAAKGGDWFDGGILIQLHQHTFTPVHGFIENAWNHAYGGIAESNNLLGGGSLDANQTAQIRGLRAFFYMRLLDMFGNVKIVTENSSDAPQSSRAEVFDFVEGELLDILGLTELTAGADLSGSFLGTDVDAYRVNQYAALGLLSKLYLNAEVYRGTAMYDKAAIAAGLVIDSGVYSLCDDGCTATNLGKRAGVDTDPDDLEGYAAVFAPNNNGNPEHIFSDLYLVRGEAMARMSGNWNMALDDVNTVRARAKVSALSSLDADSFYDERGREMFQESSRRTDMIRFGKFGGTWWEKAPSDSTRELFPIPQGQIDSSDGSLTQNPGY